MPSRLRTIAGVTTVAAFTTVPLAAQQKADLAPYLMADRAAEIALARTAAPKHVSDSATVLVLTKTGFVEAVRGSNGFTCLVHRSFDGPLGTPGFWDPSIRAPFCLNPPAVSTVLPAMRKRDEWIMAGVSPTNITERTRRAYASREFTMPAAGSMAFMLSPQQHLANANPHWMPHLMFYYDKSIPAAIWGLGGVTNTLIDGSVGDDVTPVLTLLIPVRRWSDGSLAIDAATEHKP